MKDFWEQQAREYKAGIHAVNFDIMLEDLESFFLGKLRFDGQTFCDAGCGNGRTLLELAKQNPSAHFYGFDFSDGMISVAKAEQERLKIKNVIFSVADACGTNFLDTDAGRFDVVLTKRLMINLKGDDKNKVVRKIHHALKPGGLYLMLECFIEPLEKINQIRKSLGLEEIAVKSFNEYLKEEHWSYIKNFFSVESKNDFVGLYYFISRIFNAHLSRENIAYDAPINKLAVQLTKAGVNPVEGYAPEVMFHLRKK
ncbi:MAG: class I SAM-dependent methyltransferase [Candidatus Omnitrophica bacterium]|nr:class I SAM-dependent methyltransferase [Candidatus Omnitrophota bacterium]